MPLNTQTFRCKHHIQKQSDTTPVVKVHGQMHKAASLYFTRKSILLKTVSADKSAQEGFL
jgi:hypothetical protein